MPTPNTEGPEPERLSLDDASESAAAASPDPLTAGPWPKDPRQLSLFEPPPLPDPEFVHGIRIDRSGINRYIHIIRGPHDPERSPRPKGGRKDRAPHRTFAKMSVDRATDLIVSLLNDRRPRTFNAMTVELFDLNADTLIGSPVDRALWRLVKASRLEHTMTAPVLFRLTS